MTPAERLTAGLRAIEFTFPELTQARLLAYLNLLSKWNRTYNLTAIRDLDAMVTQHLIDSLAILPILWQLVLARSVGFAQPTRSAGATQCLANSLLCHRQFLLADVGSGAGLPGIPLAIACPQLGVTLIETVEKKSAFQRQAKLELNLDNVTVVNGRVEQLPAAGFDAVISRAFADLADFVDAAGHLVPADGRLYAMKGVFPESEIARLPDSWLVESSTEITVPGLNAQRHLIVLRKT